MVRSGFSAPAALVSILLLLSGCSGDGGKEESLTALAPVDRTVQTNPNRNPEVVAEKAAAIDPCSLLQAADPADGVSARTVAQADGPHECSMTDNSVRVEVYTASSEHERHLMARERSSGAATYRTELDKGRCLVDLPISHDRSISFSGSAPCATVTTYAAAAAEVMQQEPRTVTRPQGLQRVSACDLVRQAKLKSAPPESASTSTLLDQCVVEGSGSTLKFIYRGAEARGYETAHQVAGTTVLTNPSENSCFLRWPLTEADVSVREGDVLNALVSASTCKQALGFANALVPAANRVPSPDREPVDLLYAWGEPDTSAVGACADIDDQAELECTPAEDADVPDDRRELIRKAEADPNVLCAAAAPVVRRHYDDSLAGTTTLVPHGSVGRVWVEHPESATRCAFGESNHELEISIMPSTGTPRITGEEEVSGHPTHIAAGNGSRSYLVARDEMGEPGFLTVEVQVRSTRGDLAPGSGRIAKLDTEALKTSDDFVADLAETLL